MNKILIVLGLITALGTTPAAMAQNKALTFGVHPWPENIAVAHLWKQLLDKRGYHIKLLTAGKAPVWTAVAKGDASLDFEAWLPHADANYYKRFKSKITLIGPWFEHATLGLVVPDYMHIKTIRQLKAHAREFTVDGSPTIVGIGAGSALTALTHKTIKAYGLPFKLQNSSSTAMMAALSRAYAQKKPIVVTLWDPHWAWAAFKLHYLKDSKGTYGSEDHIYIFAHKGFRKAHPKVARWLSHFRLDSAQLAQLMNIVRKSPSPDAGVQRWINHHRAVTQAWFKK